MNSLLDTLREQLRTHLTTRAAAESSIDTLIATVEARGDATLTDAETATLNEARATIATIDEARASLEDRIKDLENRNEARQIAERSAAALPTPQIGGAVVKAEARTYSPFSAREGRSFFSDAFNAQQGDYDARSRIERHNAEVRKEGEGVEQRATATSAFAGLVVPQYLVDMAALALRNGRPFANICNRMPLPDQGMSLIIPRGTTAATTAIQATENSAVSNTDEVWANLTVPVVTIAGQQDVSRQSLERGIPGLDALIWLDLAADYAAKLDSQLLIGTGSSGQALGLQNTAGIFAATLFGAVPTATNFTSKLAGQVAAIAGAGTVIQPRVVVMHPRRWGWLQSLVDTTGRPLAIAQPLTGWASATPLTGITAVGGYSADGSPTRTEANFVGVMNNGLPVLTDANIPTTVGTNVEDLVFIVDTMQCLLWEAGSGAPQMLRFEQTTGGSLTTKLVAYNYAAFTAGRYPGAVGKIGGLDSTATFGLVAPTF